jgi:hypothetical protein
MSAPYRRIILQQLTIIFGGFLIMSYSGATIFLYILIALKTVIDIRVFLKIEEKNKSVEILAKNDRFSDD